MSLQLRLDLLNPPLGSATEHFYSDRLPLIGEATSAESTSGLTV
jgi:hypothetical protein